MICVVSNLSRKTDYCLDIESPLNKNRQISKENSVAMVRPLKQVLNLKPTLEKLIGKHIHHSIQILWTILFKISWLFIDILFKCQFLFQILPCATLNIICNCYLPNMKPLNQIKADSLKDEGGVQLTTTRHCLNDVANKPNSFLNPSRIRHAGVACLGVSVAIVGQYVINQMNDNKNGKMR